MARDTKLKVLSIGCVNISGVNPEFLAAGLNKVNTARLCNTAITTEQLEALFTVMAERSELKEVDLGHNNLAEVNADVLAHGKKNIDTVKLYERNLSGNQIETLIRHVGNKLKTPDICFKPDIKETPIQGFMEAESTTKEFSYLMH